MTSGLAFIIVVAPWFIRNYRLFHQFIPFRDTMGLEWIIGNSGDSFHWRPYEVGPWHNEAEWAEFIDECAKYEAEIDREIAEQKLTLAELDEEEQSLERLPAGIAS